MCLGVPARVVHVTGTTALVDERGRPRRATTIRCPDVAEGDWVLLAAGQVIRRLEPTEAAGLDAELERAERAAASSQPSGAPP